MEENNKTAEELKMEIEELRQKVDRLEAENKELHLLSSITKQMTDAVIVTGLNSRITYVNPAFQKLFGFSEDEVIGQLPDMLNMEPNSKQIQKDIYDTISSGRKSPDAFIDAKWISINLLYPRTGRSHACHRERKCHQWCDMELISIPTGRFKCFATSKINFVP